MDPNRSTTSLRRSRSSSDIIDEDEPPSALPEPSRPTSKPMTPNPLIPLPPLPSTPTPVGADREADIGSDDDEEPSDDPDAARGDRPASRPGLQEEDRVQQVSVPSWVIEDRLAKAGIEVDSGAGGSSRSGSGHGDGVEGLKRGKSMRMMLSVGNLGMVGEEGEEGDAEERHSDGGTEESLGSSEEVLVVVPDVDVVDRGGEEGLGSGGMKIRKVSALEARMGKMMAEMQDETLVSEDSAEEEDVEVLETVESEAAFAVGGHTKPEEEQSPAGPLEMETSVDSTPAPVSGDAEAIEKIVETAARIPASHSDEGTPDVDQAIGVRPQASLAGAYPSVETTVIEPASNDVEPMKGPEVGPPMPAETLRTLESPPDVLSEPTKTDPITTSIPIHEITIENLSPALPVPIADKKFVRPQDRTGSRIPVRARTLTPPIAAQSKENGIAEEDVNLEADRLPSSGGSRSELKAFKTPRDVQRLRSGRRMTVLTKNGLTLEVREDLPQTPHNPLSSILPTKLNLLRHPDPSKTPEPGPTTSSLPPHTTPPWLRARYQSAGTAQAPTPHDDIDTTKHHRRHMVNGFSRYSVPLPISRRACSAMVLRQKSRSEWCGLVRKVKVERDVELDQCFLGPVCLPSRGVVERLRGWRDAGVGEGWQVPGGVEAIKANFGSVRPAHEVFAELGKVHWAEFGKGVGVKVGPQDLRGKAVPPVLSREAGRLIPVDERITARPWTSPEGFFRNDVQEGRATIGRLQKGLAFRQGLQYVDTRRLNPRYDRVARGAEEIRVRT